MGSNPTKRANLIWENNSGIDFLQLKDSAGRTFGWIDGAGVPSGSLLPLVGAVQFSGTPTGACSGPQIAVNSGTGDFYSCSNGAWVKVGPTALVSPVTSPNPLSFDVNVNFKGPNPYVDVTRYGVRSPGTSPQTTAGITSGTNAATLAAVSTFVNGDGVVIYGAGETNTMATPGAPTITPSVAAHVTGSGIVSSSPAGVTTYSYKIVARDFNGGLTAASSVGTTTTGQASLGPQNVAIASFSRTNNTITVQTSSAHTIAVGAFINVVVQVGQDATFAGWFIVATVPDNTHFTYLCGTDTRNGGATTTGVTGASVNWYNCNHISWSAVTGAWQYYIYGRTGGSFTLLGVSEPSSSNGDSRLNWDDFGSPYMDGIQLPAYVPSTAPSVATNDWLSTTIVSGAGTTSVVLANNASNTVAGATFLFDNAPGIKAAAAASNSLLYFPAGGNYVINSTLTFPGQVAISQAGIITLNETLSMGVSGGAWYGDLTPQAWAQPSFGGWPAALVTVGTANPGVYATNSGAINFKGLHFNSNATNAARLMILDPYALSTPIPGFSINDCQFTTGGGAGDYISQLLITRSGAGIGESDDFIRRTLFLTGPSGTPNLPTASALFRNIGLAKFEDIFFSGRGMASLLPQFFTIDGIYNQGGIMPSVLLGGTSVGAVNISNVNLDTTSYLVANLNTNQGGSLTIRNSSASASGATLVTGTPFNSVTTLDGSQFGQNINATSISGGPSSTGNITTNGLGITGYSMAAPSAPTVQLGAGGSCSSSCVAAGTWYYAIVAYDVYGGNAAVSPSTAVTTDGTKTVTVSWTPLGGQVLTGRARSNTVNSPSSVALADSAGTGTTLISYVDSTNGPIGGSFYTVSLPGGANAVSASVGSKGVVAGTLQLSPTPFASLGTPTGGLIKWCPDCTGANPCAGSGPGAYAKANGSAWVCN